MIEFLFAYKIIIKVLMAGLFGFLIKMVLEKTNQMVSYLPSHLNIYFVANDYMWNHELNQIKYSPVTWIGWSTFNRKI